MPDIYPEKIERERERERRGAVAAATRPALCTAGQPSPLEGVREVQKSVL
jgi:hypothetical protein